MLLVQFLCYPVQARAVNYETREMNHGRTVVASEFERNAPMDERRRGDTEQSVSHSSLLVALEVNDTKLSLVLVGWAIIVTGSNHPRTTHVMTNVLTSSFFKGIQLSCTLEVLQNRPLGGNSHWGHWTTGSGVSRAHAFVYRRQDRFPSCAECPSTSTRGARRMV
jgi:hypothetical protein